MSNLLLDEAEAVNMICERIHSREWWVIFGASDQGHRLCVGIESEFYGTPESSADFEVVCGCFGGVPQGICFARKTRCTPAQLSKCLEKTIDGTRDVIGCPDMPMQVLHWWVTTYDAWRMRLKAKVAEQ